MATSPRRMSGTGKTTTPKRGANGSRDSKEAVAATLSLIRTAASHGYQFYVYTLSDQDGVFYVGKGTGARLFAHEKLAHRDPNTFKAERLLNCAPGALRHDVLAFFTDEGAALACEAERIVQGVGLTNIAPGWGDPKELARARARTMLSRIVPFGQSMARHFRVTRPIMGMTTARELYDAIVENLQRQAIEPCPTSITIDATGAVRFGHERYRPERATRRTAA